MIRASVIAPIVFCASLVPCASETSPPATISRAGTLHVDLLLSAARDPAARKVDSSPRKATDWSDRGRRRTLDIRPPYSTPASQRHDGSARKAADDASEALDGSPKFQVTRFQIMAPDQPGNHVSP